ncbi:AEC family transporter, partial [Paracoccaceae bacterium]|nr:AEC family transporter [Paracoccaceae bacterium]
MIDHFLNGVLPIFSVGILGFLLGKRQIFNFEAAMVLNKFVMLIGVPSLIILLLSKAPISEFNFQMLSGYFFTELVLYLTGILISKFIFQRETKEAVLIGLCIALTNHVLFVLPIAETLFGTEYTKPIVAIITMDGLVLFAGTIILLDFLETQDLAVADTFKKIIFNPPLIALLIGLVFGLSRSKIPVGIEVFLNAVAVSASPVLLFSLGIILSRPYKEVNLALPLTITFIKLVIHPIFAGIIFTAALALPTELKNPAIMTAAAPCGLMSFMLALNYKVKVDVIARAVLISSVGSTITI